ncbi:uncharacterized protein LOC123543053, partial [Mercenaria mercenaria]|uniref:uncharacterized protein LOC123543053 n=1 Tax=Mercenaria mercenaria TaxID=6596 RepID=UPI00234EBD6E
IDVDKAKVCDLRQYLRQRGLPVSGSKHELIQRAKGADEIGKRTLEETRIADENFAAVRRENRLVSPLGESLPEHSTLKSGWTRDVTQIPQFTNDDLYNYLQIYDLLITVCALPDLVLNDSRTFDNKPINAKKQLKAKVFYTDRHLHSVEFHEINRTISHCYVRAKVLKSLPGMSNKENKFEYRVWTCLSKISGRVHAAGCECDAGEGESCNHVAALMYALVDVSEKKKEGLHAVTSKECLWNQPRSRKLSPKKVNDLVFKKQKFNTNESTKVKLENSSSLKRSVEPVNLERFCNKLQKCNPYAGFLLSQPATIKKFQRPNSHNTTSEVSDLGLSPPPFMYRDCVNTRDEKVQIAFKNYLEKLCVTSEKCVLIEQSTRKQLKNHNWKIARADRLTSSNFGLICKRRDDTPPDSMLKTVLGYTDFDCASVKWGRTHEPAARRFYLKNARQQHSEITVTECGFIVCTDYPYLGCSPDGMIHCPHYMDNKDGVLEIKCPYKYRMESPLSAAQNKDFFCELVNGELKLKRNHPYYFQVQGQMAVTHRKWCDFFVWTLNGYSVERIQFDFDFWQKMHEKLTSFFMQFVIPEIFTRRVKRGKCLL